MPQEVSVDRVGEFEVIVHPASVNQLLESSTVGAVEQVLPRQRSDDSCFAKGANQNLPWSEGGKMRLSPGHQASTSELAGHHDPGAEDTGMEVQATLRPSDY